MTSSPANDVLCLLHYISVNTTGSVRRGEELHNSRIPVAASSIIDVRFSRLHVWISRLNIQYSFCTHDTSAAPPTTHRSSNLRGKTPRDSENRMIIFCSFVSEFLPVPLVSLFQQYDVRCGDKTSTTDLNTNCVQSADHRVVWAALQLCGFWLLKPTVKTFNVIKGSYFQKARN